MEGEKQRSRSFQRYEEADDEEGEEDEEEDQQQPGSRKTRRPRLPLSPPLNFSSAADSTAPPSPSPPLSLSLPASFTPPPPRSSPPLPTLSSSHRTPRSTHRPPPLVLVHSASRAAAIPPVTSDEAMAAAAAERRAEDAEAVRKEERLLVIRQHHRFTRSFLHSASLLSFVVHQLLCIALIVLASLWKHTAGIAVGSAAFVVGLAGSIGQQERRTEDGGEDIAAPYPPRALSHAAAVSSRPTVSVVLPAAGLDASVGPLLRSADGQPLTSSHSPLSDASILCCVLPHCAASPVGVWQWFSVRLLLLGVLLLYVLLHALHGDPAWSPYPLECPSSGSSSSVPCVRLGGNATQSLAFLPAPTTSSSLSSTRLALLTFASSLDGWSVLDSLTYDEAGVSVVLVRVRALTSVLGVPSDVNIRLACNAQHSQ